MKLWRLTATHPLGGSLARFSPYANGLLSLEGAHLARRGWNVTLAEEEIDVAESGLICGGDWPNVAAAQIAGLCRGVQEKERRLAGSEKAKTSRAKK